MRLVRLDWNGKRHNYKEAVCLFIHLNMHLHFPKQNDTFVSTCSN